MRWNCRRARASSRPASGTTRIDDDQLTQDEIARVLTTLFSSGVGLTSGDVHGNSRLQYRSTMRPLRFIPDPMLRRCAQTRDRHYRRKRHRQTSRFLMPIFQPIRLGLQSMQPGIYRVEIEHPSLARIAGDARLRN